MVCVFPVPRHRKYGNYICAAITGSKQLMIELSSVNIVFLVLYIHWKEPSLLLL